MATGKRILAMPKKELTSWRDYGHLFETKFQMEAPNTNRRQGNREAGLQFLT